MNTDLVGEACREVDFFQNKISEIGGGIPFCDLPLLEKDEIVADPLKLMAPRYLPLLYSGELVRNDTSGSTG